MKQLSVNSRARQAFTLIELLVVIAIIGILAAMILPALAGVKKSTQSKMAKAEMTSLLSGIASYQNDYSRLPASQDAMKAASPDYTFGTYRQNHVNDDVVDPSMRTSPITTKPLNTTVAPLRGGNTSVYQNCNAEIMDILLGSDTYSDNHPNPMSSLNPRKSPYFQAKFVNSTEAAGISLVDHVYRDPWGNPYIITLDLNYDDRCVDAFYGTVQTNNGSAMIWSFGPDGQIGANNSAADLKKGFNKDNVLSWQ